MAPRPTQKQVAQRAGVSQTVVSQVLNDQSGQARIHPETRARVQKAIEQLGYVPNVAARRLVGANSSLIGVFTYEAVFPTSTRDFYAPFLDGIEDAAAEHGLDLLLYTSGSGTKRKRHLTDSTRGRLTLTDGTILLGQPDAEGRLELAELVKSGHPVVFIGRREIPDVTLNCTEADYAGATAALTRRFQHLGHQKLVYLGSPELTESALDREHGFLQALPSGTVKRLKAETLSLAFLHACLKTGVTGFVTENDTLMRQLLHMAQQLDWHVPQHFSAALLGDAITGTQHDQRWTRFEIPRREMGRGAVQALQNILAGQQPSPASFPCSLIEGCTLAPPPLPKL